MTTNTSSRDAAYENAAGIVFDAEGHAPATLALCCGYCKRGEITAIIEMAGHGYLSYEVWTGTECDTCMAEWEKDGTPRKGPNRAYFDYEQMVAFYAAQEAAAAATEQAAEVQS